MRASPSRKRLRVSRKRLGERLRGPCPVRALALPVVAQLRNGLALSRRHEDRVVAKPLVAARSVRDGAGEYSGPAKFVAVGRDRDQLADVARTTVADVVELTEQSRDA